MLEEARPDPWASCSLLCGLAPLGGLSNIPLQSSLLTEALLLSPVLSESLRELILRKKMEERGVQSRIILFIKIKRI